MALKLLAADGVKVYNLSSGKSLPEWVSEKKRRKNSQTGEERVELLQDFDFPSACRRISATASGDCLIATGNYPPQVRLFDVAQLSSKVTRHFDAEIVDFEILTEDFSKLAFLCGDRTVKFHARFGHYHESRIPMCGRELLYVPYSAQLLIAGSSPDLHRLDLADGKFLEPITTHLESINACDLSSVHGLVCCAGSDGCLECVDSRQKTTVGALDVASLLQKDGSELTAVRFDASGLQLAAGTSDGTIGLFDLRSQKPVVSKEHMYDSPIHTLHYLNPESRANNQQSNKIASADSFVVKIWDTVTADTYTNIEPGKNAGINHLHWWKDSGLFFVACDDSKIQSYFIPSLGAAPQWCSFLEGMTEELEEEAGHVLYDDYRFVTQDELSDAGLSHLIGTDLLKAYMHGYFVRNKLYSRALLMNKPQVPVPLIVPDGRISSVKKVSASKKGTDENNGAGKDERFNAILEDPAFRIDENREPYSNDSLLVPSDSVRPNFEGESSSMQDGIEDASRSFAMRTAEFRKLKKRRHASGSTEFRFTTKGGPTSKHHRRKR